MKHLFFFALSILMISRIDAQSAGIDEVIDLINSNSITNYITALQNFGTRFMMSPNRFEVAEYIKAEFESMGFTDVKLDSFLCRTSNTEILGLDIDTTTIQVNVVATLPGTEKPDEIYIICGHYDSFTDNADLYITAPGADDNASGTTAVLESARAVMAAGYQPKATLRFIALAAEELMGFGDGGSEMYAPAAATRGDDIKFVVNNDMIGYYAGGPASNTINMGHHDSPHLGRAFYFANNYSDLYVAAEGYNGADLRPFIEEGYDGVYFEETPWPNPNYHKSYDVVENVDIQYCTEAIKASCAVLIGLESVLTDVDDYVLPQDFTLFQNYPNPFNPSTKINYEIPEAGNVTLIVYDILGRKVAELVNQFKPAGFYSVEFNPNTVDTYLSSGIYLYSLNVNGFHQSRKMMLLK
ncbi:M20/M25/M40 family metallo-hydrolase [Bacteroidota bacterium]